MKLRLENIRLPLADFDLVLDGDFDFRLLAILGPSGAGKTSLLEIIAGLRRPRSGRITLDGEALFDASRHFSTPARHRRVGYVPQDLALFPHLDVRANVTYGGGKNASPEKLTAICEAMEMGSLLERMPASLSGGEKQRVAFARAIFAAPRLLLLDEPLSNLDQPLKERIFPYLQRMRDDLGVPMLYVTHSTEEAHRLADDVLRMEAGRITVRLPASDR